MGRKKHNQRHKSKKHHESSPSSSSQSSYSSSSFDSSDDSSSESELSIDYGIKKRNNYQKKKNKQTRDIEDDYNLPDSKKSKTIIQSQHLIKSRFTPQKSKKSFNGRSQRNIEADFLNVNYQVPTNTNRVNGGDKIAYITEFQKSVQDTRSRAKSDVFNQNSMRKIQVEDVIKGDESQNSQNNDLDMKRKFQRRQSHKIMNQSHHSLQSNASQKGNFNVASPQYDSSNGFNFKQQGLHHTSNFARIAPINNSLDNSKNDPKNISINNTANVNQQENQQKENEQDILKLEIKNKELNRIQIQQRQALTTVGNKLKKKQSIEHIEFFNRQQEKQQSEKKKHALFYNNCIQKTKKLWSALIKKIQYYHFLTDFVYQIANVFGLKSIFHFKFITTFINYYLFGTVLFIFPLIKLIVNNKDQFSSQGLQDTQGLYIYFNILTIALGGILILMSYYRYLHYQKNSVVFEVQRAKGLKYFTMIFCEYNWKIPGQKPRLWFQLSLTNKVFSSFEEEDQAYRKLIYVNYTQQLLKDLVFYLLYISSMVFSGYFMLLLSNNKLFDKQIIPFSLFLNECLFSLVAIAFVEILLLVIWFLQRILLHFENSSLQLKAYYAKEFFFQAIVYSFYIFIRSSASFTQDEFIERIVDNTYLADGYVCPQQSSANGLLSLYLTHYLFVHYFKQYFKLFALNLTRQSEGYIKTGLKCALENQSRRQLKVIEDTIPLIVSNMIIFMNTPFNFALFPIALILNLILLIHNYFFIKKWKTPEYLTITSIDTHGILVKMFLLTVFFMFIHFFFIGLLDQPLYHFADDPKRVCGPFTESYTSIISYTFWYLYDTQFFESLIKIIFWQPFLVSVIAFFILKTIADNRQYQKWVKILQYRNKDINSVKKHYKKKVSKLQQQLENAAKGIKQIQKENLPPPATKLTQQKPQEEINVSSNLQANEHQKSIYEQIRTDESQVQQHTQNHFLRPRKRSSFINQDHSDIQNFHTKPDSDF